MTEGERQKKIWSLAVATKSRELRTTVATSFWRIARCGGDSFLEEPCSGTYVLVSNQLMASRASFRTHISTWSVHGPLPSLVVRKKHMLCQDDKFTPQTPDQRHMNIRLRSFPRQRMRIFIQSSLHAAAAVRRPSLHVSHGWRSHSPTVCGQVVFCDFPSLPALNIKILVYIVYI